ncbi:MAG: hypothetical protein O7G84_04920 [Gammaproteobacteria bacterium]|nr:hypothetical protein [Gammaproteobacteria bacterium]
MARKRRLRSRDYMSGRALFDDVVAYCELGEHRTGSEDDLETADWLYRSLRRAQIDAQRHPFELDQFFLERHRLLVEDEVQESFPLWPPCASDTPVSAQLRYVDDLHKLPDLHGCVAIVDVVQGTRLTQSSRHLESLKSVEEAGAAAILVVTPHASGELVALDTMPGLEPWRLPVLLIGTRIRDKLIAAERRGAQACLQVSGEREGNAIAYDVVGRIERGPRTVVVSTSYSGWFRAAGERGPGVALWIALALSANSRKSDTSYVFIASSGHELGGLGIRYFLDAHAPSPEAVTSWLHLGAAIATFAYEGTGEDYRRTDSPSHERHLTTNDDTMVPLLKEVFEGENLEPELTNAPSGEMRTIADRGYRVWGFAGRSALHHLRQDLPEASTSPALLEPIGRRILRVVEGIEQRVA